MNPFDDIMHKDAQGSDDDFDDFVEANNSGSGTVSGSSAQGGN